LFPVSIVICTETVLPAIACASESSIVSIEITSFFLVLLMVLGAAVFAETVAPFAAAAITAEATIAEVFINVFFFMTFPSFFLNSGNLF
jgi:hypothetical protein